MGEHTPTPQWSLHRQRDECMGGDYYRYSIWLGERIVLMADIAPNPLNSEKTVGDLVEAVNNHARLLTALRNVLYWNAEFRAGMPDGWEGDPLQDACEEARKVVESMGGGNE